MKLNVLSDLHLSRGPLAIPENDADLVVLAGDIARPRGAVSWASGFAKPVLYVPGNHEFYGSSLAATTSRLHELCAGTPVQLLDDGECIIDGVRFLGSTLWTDFQLFGDSGRAMAAAAAMSYMRDFSRIRLDDASDAPFTPDACAARFARHAAWLASQLDEDHDGPTVVITHHAPSRQSIAARFEGSPINACFVSDAEHLLGAPRVQAWIHGHTHDSFDYRIAGTRVVCNPRGYVKDGVLENARFDPDFIVEV